MPALPSPPVAASPPRRRSASSRPRERLLLVAGPLALLLSACGSAGGDASSAPTAGEYGDSNSPQGSSAPPAGDPAAGASPTVTYRVADYTFPALTVAPGTRVQVVDGDDESHTVTAEDGSFDTGSFNPDTPGRFTAPTKPGTYRITCTIHPSMHGEIVVR